MADKSLFGTGDHAIADYAGALATAIFPVGDPVSQTVQKLTGAALIGGLTAAVPVIPSGLKLADGLFPTIFADFAIGSYWFGRSYPDFATWLTACGGVFSRASTALALVSGVWTSFGNNAPRLGDGGLTMEGAKTNKCTNYNANPTDLTNVVKGGDAAATLTVVDDTAALVAAGLGTICSTGKVYKLDNSAGVAVANADVVGATGNTNSHAASAFVRGSGSAAVLMGGSVNAATALTATYVRRSFVGTPASTAAIFRVEAAAGAIVYFVLNQLEEADFSSAPIVVAGSAATRASDVLTIGPTSGKPFMGYNPSEVTMFVAGGKPPNPSGFPTPLVLDGGNTNNEHLLYYSAATQLAASQERVAGVAVAGTSQSIAALSTFRLAAAFRVNDFAQAVNGVLGTASAGASFATVTTLRIGYRAGNQSHWGARIEQFAVYPRRIPNAQLQALTA